MTRLRNLPGRHRAVLKGLVEFVHRHLPDKGAGETQTLGVVTKISFTAPRALATSTATESELTR